MRNEKGQFVKGYPSWLGHHHSLETRKKLSDARRRTITLKNAIRNNENLD